MKPSPTPLPAEIKSRLIRFDELIACKTAFIDANTPGSDQKENFCLIGGGVAENPEQVVHIDIPHGFDIGGARQPNGCKNSHHSHDTEEVFFVHKGSWKFTWGHDGSDGEVILNAGDTISLPTQVFRGFENVGPDDGFLYAILGLNKDGSCGHVTWAPYVYREAAKHGLVLLDDGRLINTLAGNVVPKDSVVAKATTEADLKKFKTLSLEEMSTCVAFEQDLEHLASGGLSNNNDVSEKALIGCANRNEKIDNGSMKWEHAFQVRRLQLLPGASVKNHTRAEEEVLFVHSGSLQINLPQAQLHLNKGDLFTVPVSMPRAFRNSGREVANIIVVRRGDHPEAANFV